MALTVIPEKDFEELVGKVNEASSGIAFSWEELEKDKANTSYRDILNYMKSTNVKKIGTGSSRTAFFLPPGSVKEDSSVPSCFKVAKNKKGVAQNEAEISLYSKYGKKKPCFPELYESDEANKYYIQTEVGRALNKKKTELKDFFSDWNDFVSNMKRESNGKLPYYYFGGEDFQFKDNSEYTWHLFQMAKALNEEGFLSYWSDDPQYIVDELSEISDEFPKYGPIVDFFRFSIEGGWKEVEYGDFAVNDNNWAFVLRNGEYTLIPIDWGFTKEIAEKYY